VKRRLIMRPCNSRLNVMQSLLPTLYCKRLEARSYYIKLQDMNPRV
jgi:hypothetical protein